MTSEELFALTTVKNWKIVVDRTNQMLANLSDDDLQRQIAPGRNRIYYILGHLAAVNDRLFPMLFLGKRLHPELDDPFLEKPDKAVPDPLPASELRAIYEKITSELTAAMEKTAPLDWLKRHEAVSEEDFKKEPHRNRLAVLQSRTGHIAYHAGQIRLTQ